MSDFHLKLERLLQARANFAILNVSSAGSKSTQRAARIYQARHEDFLCFMKKKGII